MASCSTIWQESFVFRLQPNFNINNFFSPENWPINPNFYLFVSPLFLIPCGLTGEKSSKLIGKYLESGEFDFKGEDNTLPVKFQVFCSGSWAKLRNLKSFKMGLFANYEGFMGINWILGTIVNVWLVLCHWLQMCSLSSSAAVHKTDHIKCTLIECGCFSQDTGYSIFFPTIVRFSVEGPALDFVNFFFFSINSQRKFPTLILQP